MKFLLIILSLALSLNTFAKVTDRLNCKSDDGVKMGIVLKGHQNKTIQILREIVTNRYKRGTLISESFVTLPGDNKRSLVDVYKSRSGYITRMAHPAGQEWIEADGMRFTCEDSTCKSRTSTLTYGFDEKENIILKMRISRMAVIARGTHLGRKIVNEGNTRNTTVDTYLTGHHRLPGLLTEILRGPSFGTKAKHRGTTYWCD